MEELLAAFPELQLRAGEGKVICSLSRHEMPSRPEVVRAYVEGRKFKTLKAEKDFDFERLRPYIIPSQKRRRRLFCGLTNRYLNRKPAEVDLHLKGKRYKRALEKYNAGLLSLFVEKPGKKQKTGGLQEDESGEWVEAENEGTEEEGEGAENEGEGEGTLDQVGEVMASKSILTTTKRNGVTSELHKDSTVHLARKRRLRSNASLHSPSPTKPPHKRRRRNGEVR